MAGFQPAWWNAEEFGGFDLTEVWAVEESIAADMVAVFAMLPARRHYPDRLGSARDFKRICKPLEATTGMIGTMESLHISQAELMRDLGAILERVERGAEFVVEKDQRPVAVIHAPARPGRLLSESLALARSHGSTVTLDDTFGSDMEAIIAGRRDALQSRWD